MPGTRYIEAGHIDKGIRVLEWYLKAARKREKGVVLTNLCMGYTLKREYEQAASYCDQAVASYRGTKVPYNNRGVLRALQGDYEGAMADLRKAGCVGECPADLTKSTGPNMSVARRNLSRVQQRHAALQRQTEGERISQKDIK